MFRLFGWIQVAKKLQQLQSAFNVNVMSTDVYCVFPISQWKVEIGILGYGVDLPPQDASGK